MSTGELRADGPGETRGGRAHRSLAEYRTSLWLLVLTVALGVGAYVIYPKDAPVAGTEAVQGIAVVASFTPNAIVANQTPDPQIDGFSLQIVVHAAAPVTHSGYVTLALPGNVGGSYLRCPPPAYYCAHDPAGDKDVSYQLPPNWTDSGPNVTGDRHELRLTIKVSGVGSNLSSNAEYITVLEPPMSFQQLAPNLPYVQVQSVYAESVPGNGYTWNTGTSPVYLDGFDRWTGTSASALQDTASPTLDSGTDLGVQARDGNRQFIAGIVLGAAGGALVGSLQEFLDSRRKSGQGGATQSS